MSGGIEVGFNTALFINLLPRAHFPSLNGIVHVSVNRFIGSSGQWPLVYLPRADVTSCATFHLQTNWDF